MKKAHSYYRLNFRIGLLILLVFYIVLPHSVVFPNGTKPQVEREQRDLRVRVKEPGQKVALVIGNAEYDISIGKLKNPVNDATDIAAALSRLGFKLVAGKPQLNLNKRQMLELIREFGNQIGQGGVGIFYFAGHGVQIDKRNYLIPITNSLRYQEDAEFEAVDVDQILRQMEYAGNALNIMILDACRNNELPKKSRNAGNGLGEPLRKPSGVFIAFAARDGQVALENPSGRNGLYTQELLKYLETPNLRLEDIFINTRREVKRLSKKAQEPIEYGSLDEIFYFKLNENIANQSQRNPSTPASVVSTNQREPATTNQSLASTPKVETTLKNSIGMEFVWIPPGEFMMGTSMADRRDLSGVDNEEPQRQVKIAEGFLLGKYEVTIRQWKEIMGNNPSYYKECNNENCPVDSIEWHDAKQFIERLNAKDDGYEYHLPSEAEWEYAARAGTTTRFYWGDDIKFKDGCQYANVNDLTAKNNQKGWRFNCRDGFAKKSPVGSFKPNSFGLYDMIGNVSEWVEDIWSESYSRLKTDGSANLEIGDASRHVQRGGAFHDYPWMSRSSYRTYLGGAGFRLVARIKR